MRKLLALILTGITLLGITSCGTVSSGISQESEKKSAEEQTSEKEIQVFIAASLHSVMDEIAAKYQEDHPDVKITYNADSSGTLMTQIEEGYACDIFFSAAKKQMDQLEADGLLIPDTRKDVVNNQVVVITQSENEDCRVTGLENLNEAESLAIAGGSVPVGKYTRQALVSIGILPETEDVSQITTGELSEALGGVEISEQANVSKVLSAIAEASCEVGTTYYSDTYGFEEQVKILEIVPYELTGSVIYPAAQVVNVEADKTEVSAASEFLAFLTSDTARGIFEKYYFDTNVE